MSKIDAARSILTLNRTVIERLSFERFSDEVNKIDDEGEISFNHEIKNSMNLRLKFIWEFP